MKRFLPILPLAVAGCVIQLPPDGPRPASTAMVTDPTPPPLPPVAAPAPVPVVAAPPPPIVVEHPPLPDSEIASVYEDVLGRRPTGRELWDWREHSRQVVVSPNDMRDQLRNSEEYRRLAPETVVRRAYREFHGREPDHEEMRACRRLLIDDAWSIGRVRQEIARRDDRGRRQNEAARRRDGDDAHRREGSRNGRASGSWRFLDERNPHAPDAIIDRAYDDLLEREPDAEGRAHYRSLLERGESERQIRARIRESLEFRVTLPDSKTRRAYLAVLGREADPEGLQGYRHRIVDDRWTEEDVMNSLRQTAEYRNRKK